MKVLVETREGGKVVEMTAADLAIVRAGAELVRLLGGTDPVPETEAMRVVQVPSVWPEPITTYLDNNATPVVVSPKRKKRAGKLDLVRDKVCLVCGKPFHDDSHNHKRSVCNKAACRLEQKREYQRAWYDKNRKVKKPTKQEAEAKPLQRAMFDKAARLNAIKSSFAHITGKDPISEVDKMARAAAQEG